MYKKLFSVLFLFSLYTICFAQKQAKPYSDDEFNQTLKDIRRFEIISLGSIPFVTFDTLWLYTSIKAKSVTNPFTAKNTLDSDEIKTVIFTSVGISLAIATTDLVINLIKRKKIDKTEKEILILPVELNPPPSSNNKDNIEQNSIDTNMEEN